MTATLSRRRLEWLVRARGTDLSAWPEQERLAALALLRRSPEAREVFADALVDEAAPEAEMGAPETVCVAERMQAALRRRLAPLPLIWRGLSASVLVGCVAAGLYLGSSQAEPETVSDGSSDLFTSVETVSFATLDQ